MEGNDIEITVDVDISHLVLGSFPYWNNGPRDRLSSGLHKLYGGNIENFRDDFSSKAINNHLYLSSGMFSPMSGGEKMVGENQNGLDAMLHLLKGKKKSNSSPYLSKDIDKRKTLSSIQRLQFFSPPEPLPNSPDSTPEISHTLQDTLSHTLGDTNSGNSIPDTFNTARPELLPSNFSTISSSSTTGATNNIVENWSLPLMPTLNPPINEPEHATGWSGEEIGAVSIISLIVPFIICSNLLVILSIARFRRLQIPTNYFITSLASVDVLVALATPFMIMVEVFQFGVPGEAGSALLCLLPNRILMMACSVSLLTLATIAYDRHTALVSPLDYVVIMTSRRVRSLVSLTWIYSVLVVWFPLLVGWHDSPTKRVQCSAYLLHGKAHALFLIAIFVPSCGVILVCYARIFSLARHHAQAIAAVEFSVNRQAKFIMKDAKYAKTLALVIGVFLTLWLPYLVTVFIKVVAGVTLSIWVQTYLMLVAVFNSGINPWIYAFKNKEFRNAFRRLYHEVFLERLCIRRLVQRRKLSSTLTTGYSGSTSRLSRADSHTLAAVTVDSTTLDNVSEKLQRSLDPLDRFDKYQDQRLSGQRRAWRSGALPGSFRALPSSAMKVKRYRQTASCTDLKDVEETIAILPRSLSLDRLGDDKTQHQTVQIDIQRAEQTHLSKLISSSASQDDIDDSAVKDKHYSSIPSVKNKYSSTNNDIFVSMPVANITSSSLLSTHRQKYILHDQYGLKSLPSCHLNINKELCMSRSSQSDSEDSLITPSKTFYNSHNVTLEALRRDNTEYFSHDISPVSSPESVSPTCLDFSTAFVESHPQMPTSALCSHFSKTDLHMGFYPDPNSLSCTVEIRVP